MAITVTPYEDTSTKAKRRVIGDVRLITGLLTFDASYVTGGLAITPAMLGFDSRIEQLIIGTNNLATRLAAWDKAAGKIRLFTAIGTEAANASDQSTINVPFTAVGE